MNVQIQSVKFDADRKLVEFVEHKMDKLDRFVERAIGADVILKLDKDHELGNKVATINLHIPGDDLVAESRGKVSRRRSISRSKRSNARSTSTRAGSKNRIMLW